MNRIRKYLLLGCALLANGHTARSAVTNGPPEIAFGRIIHGWTNYSTAFNVTHDLGKSADYASVAAFYTPDRNMRPTEFGVIVIWNGSSGQRLDFSRFDFLVMAWSSLDAFIRNPKQGDLATWTFNAPTGGSTTVPDATTRGGRSAYEIRFALSNSPLVLTTTCLIGFAARTVTANDGELYVPTSSFPGLSDVHAGDLVPGGWQYLVNAGGSTIYDGQLAMEFVVREIIELPELKIQRLNHQVRVSWPATAKDFQLECAISLSPPVTWAPVEEDIIDDNGTFTATLPTRAAATWLRLTRQSR
jgi:hypothetical protein